MKIKEIEKLINKEIEEKELINKEFTYSETMSEIYKIVWDILKDYKEDIYINSGYGTKGCVVIKASNCSATYNPGITIKIRRKKQGEKKLGEWWSYTMMYGIKSVEIKESESYDSIEEYIKHVDDAIKEHQEYKQKRINTFKKELDKLDIDFKEFYKLYSKYKDMEYSDRMNIAKSIVGEDYWKYI